MIDPCSVEPKRLISLEETIALVLAAVEPVKTAVFVELNKSLGCVLSCDIFSAINLPFDRNAAMDGYALNGQALCKDEDISLKLAGTSWAGRPYQEKLQQGQCVRILTGAVVPEGADSVVMQEMVNVEGSEVIFPPGLEPYQNIREPGEDIPKGGLACPAGKKLDPADIGLLAATGIDFVPVCNKPNVAYFSTGDELVQIGQPLTKGKIYDSNRHMLAGLLADYPVDSIDVGIIADDKRLLKNRIRRMADCNDVIISTGGASVGEADYIKEILAELGEVHVWKIALKPGKPLIFGKIGSCHYFGLPGNPVSMMLTFHLIVAPALNRLCGVKPGRPLRLTATCTSALKKSPGRQEFQRGILSQDAEGNFFVESAGRQGSHILGTMSRSNCYIVLPSDSNGVSKGDSVTVEPHSTYI